ncbi:hypothetical protein FACS1894103_3580 [Campylobacterota bacterium]|nr:hypothetical protein FACS1894103_3580 [Campylobacterota bacterium]
MFNYIALFERPDLQMSFDLPSVIGTVDAVMSLRTQTERHETPLYASLSDYAADFRITKELLHDRNIVVLHPGPVHRNVDMEDAVLADPRCLALKQVRNGVAVRMAVLSKFVLGKNDE